MKNDPFIVGFVASLHKQTCIGNTTVDINWGFLTGKRTKKLCLFPSMCRKVTVVNGLINEKLNNVYNIIE